MNERIKISCVTITPRGKGVSRWQISRRQPIRKSRDEKNSGSRWAQAFLDGGGCPEISRANWMAIDLEVPGAATVVRGLTLIGDLNEFRILDPRQRRTHQK